MPIDGTEAQKRGRAGMRRSTIAIFRVLLALLLNVNIWTYYREGHAGGKNNTIRKIPWFCARN
jgi:hypothetical protein